MQARKIVISGEVAGLQIQLGTPAFPGRFDSCDLPPKVVLFIPMLLSCYFTFLRYILSLNMIFPSYRVMLPTY